MADTIKDFLVSLGWDFSEDKHKRFIDAMRKASLEAQLLADALEAMARKAWEAVASVAQAFDQLHFASQRTGASVATIKDLGYAVGQLGGSAAAAEASLEAMGQKLRENKGNIAYLNALGLGLNKVTGQLEVQIDLLENFQKLQREHPEQAELYRQRAGEDEKTFLAMSDPKLLAFLKEAAAARKRMGFDPDQAATDANAFMTTWRRVGNELGVIAEDLFTKLMKALDGPFQEFHKFIIANEPAIKQAIEEVATAIGNMTKAWVEDFEKIIKDPTSFDNFRGGMKDFASDIRFLAEKFHAFITDMQWLYGKSNELLDFINKWSGASGARGGARDPLTEPYGAAPGSGADIIGRPGTTDDIGGGRGVDPSTDQGSGWGRAWHGSSVGKWWDSHMPSVLGGGGGGSDGGGEGTGGRGLRHAPSAALVSRTKWLTKQFMDRYGLTAEQAAGPVGYMIYETAGNLSPTALGPGGDLGLMQMVGDRKKALLARGPPTMQTNWDEIVSQLENWPAYRKILPMLKASRNRAESLRAWGIFEGAAGTPLGWKEEILRHMPYADRAAAIQAGSLTSDGGGDIAYSKDYAGLRILAGHGATRGGGAQPGLLDVARMLQATHPGIGFTSFNDAGHQFGLGSGRFGAHGQGRAFDAVTGDIEGAKNSIRTRLSQLGFSEGEWGRSGGDYSIEPGSGGGTGPHLHFQWNNAEAGARFHKLLASKSAAKPKPAANLPWSGPAWGGMGVGGGKSPFGSLQPLNTFGGGGDKHVSVNQNNHFHIDGANDPSIVAHMVASNQNRTVSDITRNLTGATG